MREIRLGFKLLSKLITNENILKVHFYVTLAFKILTETKHLKTEMAACIQKGMPNDMASLFQ